MLPQINWKTNECIKYLLVRGHAFCKVLGCFSLSIGIQKKTIRSLALSGNPFEGSS